MKGNKQKEFDITLAKLGKFLGQHKKLIFADKKEYLKLLHEMIKNITQSVRDGIKDKDGSIWGDGIRKVGKTSKVNEIIEPLVRWMNYKINEQKINLKDMEQLGIFTNKIYILTLEICYEQGLSAIVEVGIKPKWS